MTSIEQSIECGTMLAMTERVVMTVLRVEGVGTFTMMIARNKCVPFARGPAFRKGEHDTTLDSDAAH